jgi:hypothetical protein
MRRRAQTLVDLVVTLEVLLIGLGFCSAALPMSMLHTHDRSNSTRCRNNLKQIGLAAIQYSDDKRFFPHISGRNELDGGYRSNTATRVFRALVNQNYNDSPECFICPSSSDQFNPLTKAAREDIRCFRWEGADGPPARVSALRPDGVDAHDVPLNKATDLSYGWTRKFLTSNSTSKTLLAADKAMLPRDETTSDAAGAAHAENMIGNHRGVMYAVAVDAHTVMIKPDGDVENTLTISRTDVPTDGFLGVLGDDPTLGQ